MDKETFHCENCDGVFEKSWTDEDAAKELQLTFGDWPADKTAVVCDDCYKELMKAYPFLTN